MNIDEIYETGETPMIGDRIYAGDERGKEDFVTLVRSVRGTYLTTAGWPEAWFPVKHCTFIERGEL